MAVITAVRRLRRAPTGTVCLVMSAMTLLAFTGLGFVGQSRPPSVDVRPAVPTHLMQRKQSRIARANDNLFERFTRVVKSNVNKVISGLEDPEKVLDQAVDEMQGDLIKVRQSYAEVLATQRRMMSQKDEADKLANEWYKRAQLAVEKGDDELAKEALKRRQTGMDKATDLGTQINSMTISVEKLFDSVKALEAKIAEAKNEKEQLIARARTAKTTADVNDMLSDVGGTSAANAFDRMKEKVAQLETKAEVSEGMLLPAGSVEGRSLEDRFKQLESGTKVDDELAMLKGMKSLPSGGGSSGGGGSAIDDELAAMRAKMKSGQ